MRPMMTETVVVTVGYLTQTGGALLLAAVLYGLHRYYGRHYLVDWARSWLAMAVYLATAAGAFLAISLGDPVGVPRQALSIVSALAAAAQVGWLVSGTWEMVSGAPLSRERRRWLWTGLLALALATSLPFAASAGQAGARFFRRIALRGLVTGSAFLLAGFLIWRSGPRGARLGRTFVVGGHVAYGLGQLQHFVVGLLFLAGADSRYTMFVGDDTHVSPAEVR